MATSKNLSVSYGYVYKLLDKEGFARLPRRDKSFKSRQSIGKIEVPVAQTLDITNEHFTSSQANLLCFLPIIEKYQIDTLISNP